MIKLRTAVVGVGYLGRFHAQKHMAVDGIELVGVCDRDAARSASVAAEVGTTAYTDHRELLGKVDAVTIAEAAVLVSAATVGAAWFPIRYVVRVSPTIALR